MFDKIPGGKWAILAAILVGLYVVGIYLQKKQEQAGPQKAPAPETIAE